MTVQARICLVGTHNPSFGRIQLMAEGLRERGYDVASCVEPAWGSTAERVASAHRGLRNPDLARRLAASYARIATRLRALTPSPDVLLVGYPGQLDVVVLRALFPQARIVLDAFVSLDETLEDRSIGSPHGPTRLTAQWLDRLAFRLADRIVVDTAAHGRRLAVRYGLDLTRTVVVPVGAADPVKRDSAPHPDPGADSDPNIVILSSPGGAPPDIRNDITGDVIESAAKDPSHDADQNLVILSAAKDPSHHADLRVLYVGGFIPLHGVSTIVEAARRIPATAGVRFDLVGDGQDAPMVERMLIETPLPHVRLIRTWTSEEQLVEDHLSEADVCLGIFARRPKAMDVVPAKVYLGMACGLPVVTADSPAIREEILDHVASGPPPLIVCPPEDPSALAECLLELRDNPERRRQVGAAARHIYELRFRPARVVTPLVACIEDIVTRG